jgi:predicted unusual protein kinase regulating ubiquinone biosynthesis (AarF/ABC1/UbiB family)
VQHPGIDEAVRNDLGSASSIEAIVRVFGPGKLGSKQALAEISERFLEELDYRHEAEQQRWFRDFHAADPSIVVPAVLERLSARRVLTSELLTGRTLEQAAEADLETRMTYGRTLWRFVFRGNLVGGRFNADPHPGNYLFQPDGSVAFLDFGCVQPIPLERRQIARVMHRAAIERDLPKFREATKSFLATRGGGYERIALDYTRRLFEPLFGSPYRITHAYVADIVGGIQAIKRELLLGRDSRIVPLPPGALFMNRLQFGFYSVLARLDAEVDYAAVERAFLA